MNIGQSRVMLLSRNVLVHRPRRCHLPSSSSCRIILSHLPPHKCVSTTTNNNSNNNNDSRQSNRPKITNPSSTNTTTTTTTTTYKTKFPTSNNTSADQLLDDLPPPSKFTTPTNTRTHRKKHNSSIFPWRHSPHPLPRLTPGTAEEYEEGGEFGPNFPVRGGTMTGPERGLVWFQTVYVLGLRRPWGYGAWKRELEDGFLSAFAMGLQGVLVDVYRAPTSIEEDDNTDDDRDDNNKVADDNTDDETDDNAYSVRMDRTIDKSIQDSDTDQPTDGNTDTSHKKFENIDAGHTTRKATRSPPPPSKNNDEGNRQRPRSEEGPSLQDMLETNLQSLYHSAHSTAKSKLNIHLECRPRSANLVSVFTVPLLTRDEVGHDPSLRNLYPDLYRRLLVRAMEEMERSDGRKTTLSWKQVYGEMKEFVEDKVGSQEDEGLVQMTVVAQAVIECDEVFYVRDVGSGEVVQGDDDGKMREVSHLVRFEMVVDWDRQREEMRIGNWQITDWDDLLDGNIWYL